MGLDALAITVILLASVFLDYGEDSNQQAEQVCRAFSRQIKTVSLSIRPIVSREGNKVRLWVVVNGHVGYILRQQVLRAFHDVSKKYPHLVYDFRILTDVEYLLEA